MKGEKVGLSSMQRGVPGMDTTTLTATSLQASTLVEDLDDEYLVEEDAEQQQQQQQQQRDGKPAAKQRPPTTGGKKLRSSVEDQPDSLSDDNDDDKATRAPTIKTPLHVHVGIFIALLFGITGTIIGVIALAKGNDENGGSVTFSNTATCGAASDGNNCGLEGSNGKPQSLLATILERGYVNCGLSFEQVGFLTQTGVNSETQAPTYAGFDVDLCRAIAAAIFDGESEAYKPVVFPLEDRWTMLNSTKIDVLFRTTRTMQRQVFEPSIGTGMEFSSPYFYDGLGFGGIGEFVECAESGIVNGTCADLRICVWGPGTHESVVRDLIGMENIIVVSTERDYYGAFPSVCNVLAGEQVMISEATVRQMGYEGEYVVGTGLFSREPLCLVTRRGDPLWTGFVEAVRNSLVDAEEQGITQLTATNMPTTDIFGPRFEGLFQHAVGVEGNYGEHYDRNMEAYVPRSGLNLLNNGGSPRMWSFPFGDLDVSGPDLEKASPTIKTIRERGFINCGASLLLVFAKFDSVRKQYMGASVDLCKAISAALFQGVDRTLFTIIPFPDRAKVLQNNSTDLIMMFGHRIEDDVKEFSTGKGVSFSSAYFYTGTSFGGEPFFVDCAERLDVFSPGCEKLRVCTRAGSTLIASFSEVLLEEYLVPKDTTEEMFRALRSGECNTILGAAIRLKATFARGSLQNTTYVQGSRLFSIAQISLGTREDDPVWSAFVDWIFMSMIYAEENGIDRSQATLMPQTNLFGPLHSNVFYHAVNSAGNYGEFYNRTFQRALPRAGPHLLNDNLAPRQYSF